MALFSKRHYVWLASFFRDETLKIRGDIYERQYPYHSEVILKQTINNLANSLYEDNHEFNKQRFLDAIYDPREIKDHHKSLV